MAVASPYAVFRAADLAGFAPAPRPACTAEQRPPARPRPRRRPEPRPRRRLLPVGVVQGELFALQSGRTQAG